jgi:hypothetical protein
LFIVSGHASRDQIVILVKKCIDHLPDLGVAAVVLAGVATGRAGIALLLVALRLARLAVLLGLAGLAVLLGLAALLLGLVALLRLAARLVALGRALRLGDRHAAVDRVARVTAGEGLAALLVLRAALLHRLGLATGFTASVMLRGIHNIVFAMRH